MWQTTHGERTLDGAEATLIRESLTAMYDAIETTCRPADVAYHSGVELFDCLSPAQQLAMLATVGEALLYHHILPPPLTALASATAAALFGGIQVMINAELDADDLAQEDVLDPSTFWRSLVRAAVFQAGPCDGLPSPSSNDGRRWNILVQSVAGDLLATNDGNVEGLVADAAFQPTALKKVGLQIADDYFGAIAFGPSGAPLQAIRRRLDAITGLHHADDEPTC
jgi:hypothetical protein